jgi:hypothetical protein
MSERPRTINSRPAIDALNPLRRAEATRGNPAGLEFADLRNPRTFYSFKHPLDLDALRAEFVLGDGIHVGDIRGGVISFEGTGAAPAFTLEGGSEESWWSRRRRAAWWRRWNAAPRTPVPFSNPFAEIPS